MDINETLKKFFTKIIPFLENETLAYSETHHLVKSFGEFNACKYKVKSTETEELQVA